MQASLPPGSNLLDSDVNRRVLALADSSAVQIYIVGGYLRDAMLGRLSPTGSAKDIDYAISGGSAFSFARAVADKLGGHFVPLDESNDIARVVVAGEAISLDFAGCVGGSIEADIPRRDFTINALFWHAREPDLVTDLVGGVEDLKQLRIRAISENVLSEDPLRVLRAFRFAAMLKAKIDPQTLEWIGKHAAKLANVAAERINVELFQTFAYPASDVVIKMAEVGILETVFPEMVPMRQVTANAFHHLGLFEHSLETIPQLESRLETISQQVLEEAQCELTTGVTRLAATKVACILHDIGKPETWVINDDGRHTFYGHDHLGAQMCEAVAERLKWARPLDKFIAKLVKWHLRPGALFHQGAPTDKAIKRFYRSVGNDVPELMLLAFADFGATRGPGLSGENRISLENNWTDLLAGYFEFREEDKARVRLLNGSQIMHLLSLRPGPVIGQLLAALDEAQTFKEVSNVPEAERFVSNLYQEKYSK